MKKHFQKNSLDDEKMEFQTDRNRFKKEWILAVEGT